MSYPTKTIKVDDLGYTVIDAARRMLEDLLPTPVTMGNAAALGAIFLLKEAGEWKSNLLQSPKGQMYLKLAEALRAQAKKEEGL